MEVIIEMDTISVMFIEKNYCCICFEEFDICTDDTENIDNTNNKDNIEMKCCLNIIHKKCLFDILMYTQNLTLHCPLCRTEHNFINVLQLDEILDIYTQYKDTINFTDHNIRLQNIIDKYTINVNEETNRSSNKICIFLKRYSIMCVFIIVIIIFFSTSKK